MPLRILDKLKSSNLVEEIISVNFDGISDSYRLKIRVRLKNNWLMDVFEHKTTKVRRYSFHVFKNGEMIMRWDNAPHFPSVKTFPHHKHYKSSVSESKEMTIEMVLDELSGMIK